jgi:hypothetical protein
MEKQLFAAFLIHNKKDFSGRWFSESVSIALKDARNDRIVTWALADSFIEFFRKECEPFLDEFWGLSLEERKTSVSVFQKRWIVQHVLWDFLTKSNSREIQRMLSNLYKRFESDSPLIMVRSPQELDYKIKRKIRDYYNSWVVFERDKNIVWGLIVYRDGVIIDKSFSAILSRIPSFSS